ncbi:ABA4-like family protein [Pseudomonas borbori]
MKKAALPLIVLIAFSLFTLVVMAQAEQSLVQFGLQLMSRPDTAQVVIDLYILAVLAGAWMYRDNKARGKSFASVVPYLLLTAVFVSVGPLLYLVVTSLAKPAATSGS